MILSNLVYIGMVRMSEHRRRPSYGTPRRPWFSLSSTKIRLVLIFVSCVLVVNALAGERGYIETMRAKQQYQDLADSIRDLRKENVELREQARKLKEDPKTIEDLARMELGFIKPDEILFIIRDMPPIDDLPSVPKTPPIP